jgi:hypothetical protein
MNRTTQFLIALLLIPALAYPWPPDNKGKEKKYPAFYRTSVTIDGSAKEWEEGLFFLDKASRVHFALSNDSAYLYICIKIKDEAEQGKLMRNGMFFYIDPKGKKNREIFLQYPMPLSEEQESRIVSHAPGEKPDQKKIKLMYQLHLQDMECGGFREANGIQNHKNNRSGIQASMEWDSAKVLTYEARFPLAIFPSDLSASAPFTAGVTIKGAGEKPMHHEDNGMDASGNMRGSERMGGQQGRPGGMQDAERMQMAEDDSFWLPFRIAKPEK